MTQKDKQLLLKDLCARLPYGVMVRHEWEDEGIIHYTDALLVQENKDGWDIITTLSYGIVKYRMKPYLRPMSSMTEEEKEECDKWHEELEEGRIKDWKYANYVDWLNEHHLDYRGLIEKGLALEAPEGMYKIVL